MRILVGVMLMLVGLQGASAQASGAQTISGSPDVKAAEKAVADLRSLIQKQQKLNVRESYGEWAHECFTWVDLEEFKRAGKPTRIARGLRDSKEVAEIVSALKWMPTEQRKKLLSTDRRSLRPTWAQLGRISREGQTDAGHIAERMIADAIVDMVEELLESSGGREAGRP